MRTRTALAVLPLLLVAGCSGGGSDDDTSGISLPKDDFIKAADARCTQANSGLDALPDPSGPGDFQKSFQAAFELAGDAVSDLKELVAPQPDKDELEKILVDPLQAQLDALQDFIPTIAKALAKGPSGLQGLDFPDPPKVDVQPLKDYGFGSCVEFVETE